MLQAIVVQYVTIRNPLLLTATTEKEGFCFLNCEKIVTIVLSLINWNLVASLGLIVHILWEKNQATRCRAAFNYVNTIPDSIPLSLCDSPCGGSGCAIHYMVVELIHLFFML